MTIKSNPEDFQVREIPDAEFAARISREPNQFVVYEVEKSGLTSPEAFGLLAKGLGVSNQSIGYAGLKDKHAKTSQYISIASSAFGGKTILEKAEGRNWKAKLLGWSQNALEPGLLDGNSFRIVVRKLADKDCRNIGNAVKHLSAGHGSDLLFVNYFGDQRFGSARHGRGFLAKDLVKGDFERALKLAIATTARKDRQKIKAFKRTLTAGWGNWKDTLPKLARCPERRAIEHLAKNPKDFRGAFASLPFYFQQLCVQAWQSHLWNETARRCLRHLNLEMKKADDPFGEMLFPKSADLSDEWKAARLPMFSPGVSLKEPWGEFAKAVLQEEGLHFEALVIPGLRRPKFSPAKRDLFSTAKNFNLSVESADKKDKAANISLVLEFDLPSGSYATVLLKALGL